MEEWVGSLWHRAVTRAARDSHPDATVTLAQVQAPIGMLFRAAGGPGATRIAPAAQSAIGGPRRWIEHLAGSGRRAARAVLEPEVLALPPVLAVFADRALNRDLYLWMAALAAHFEPTGDWVGDNRRATARALDRFGGLRQRYAALVRAHLAQRPPLQQMRGEAAAAEAAVQAALQASLQGDAGPADHTPFAFTFTANVTAKITATPQQVRPVWLWIDPSPAAVSATTCAARTDGANDGPPRAPSAKDNHRHRTQAAEDGTGRAPFMLFFRAESLLSWSELVRVDRAQDDSDDGNALAAANDLDHLSVVPDGQACASRVKFDLDLPSAAADDLPLGPGRTLPEWDFKRGVLQADHCALQAYAARPGAPFVPPPALRRTARAMRRRLEVLRAAPRWAHSRPDGDEIDLDAWVRHATAPADAPHGDAGPAVYRQRVRQERSLATLLLADLSLSTDAHVSDTQRVIDVIRDALFVFGEALAATGDAFEMLGFSSVRRQHVRLQHLKGFDEPWDAAARLRVGAIKPGFYTRMGAAVREGTRRLAARGERQRLLLLLTDGKPNDLDVYEGRYGLEDTRHAVAEARAAGLLPFCVTIDDEARDYLPLLFGSHGYAQVRRPPELVRRLALVYAQLTRR